MGWFIFAIISLQTAINMVIQGFLFYILIKKYVKKYLGRCKKNRIGDIFIISQKNFTQILSTTYN